MSPIKHKSSVPIGVGVTDAFYRYKMEAVECEHKRRRNKTAIFNMVQIAKDLNRSPEEVIKYLGHALSSSGSYSSKSREYLLNGTHSEPIIQEKLQEYCESFVVCGLCSNPETEYRIKREAIFLKCAACGGRSEVDGSHKLCKYILTQHKLSKQPVSKKRGQGKKVTSKEKKEESLNAGNESEGKALTDGSHQKEAKRKLKKRIPQVDASTPKLGDYDEEFVNPYFSTKGNPLYVGCFDRIAKASDRDESAALDYAVRKVQNFLAKNPDSSADEIVDAVFSAQESTRILFSHEQIRIFIKAIFAPGTVDLLLKYADVLIQLAESDPSMKYLIAAVEEVCVNDHNMFPTSLMQLYEADVVQEEALLEWWAGSQSGNSLVSRDAQNALRASVAPLFSWLQEVDSDSEEEM